MSTADSYTVLARRHRSRDFDELVGQDPIVRTLRNAVASNRAAHAYLFCGTRGVGKTSMARILAKALNATEGLSQRAEIADAILRGADLDVIEIDGASNRGVNEARDLIAAAGLRPARCRFKIYIIDEVHMLTTPAFNTLLKTMEEPPEHVKFILCTTEVHKVPATIQSRCQRFDFRSLSTAEIGGQLQKILDIESVAAEEAVIAQVARLGNGSMRDALSVLDRLLAAGDRELTAEGIQETLGLPDQAVVRGLVDAIAAGDAKSALRAGAELLDRGAGVEQALETLIEHLRDLMVIASCGADSDLLELSVDARQAAAEQAARFDAAALVHMIALADAVARSARTSGAARALYEAAIVRLAMSEHLADIPALLAETASPSPAAPGGKKKDRPHERPSPEAVSPPAPASVTEPKRLAGGGRAVDDDSIWSAVLQAASGSASDRAKIEHLVCESFNGVTLRLSVSEAGAAVAGWLGTQPDALADLVNRATGRRVLVEIDTTKAKAAADGGRQREAAGRLPAVRQAMEIFDAEIVEVRDHRVEAPAAPPAPSRPDTPREPEHA